MGGKLWSYLEERFFWTEVVPRSDKRVGADRVNHVKMTWAQLAEMMQIRMGRDALRVYTCNSLCKAPPSSLQLALTTSIQVSKSDQSIVGSGALVQERQEETVFSVRT